MQAVHQHDDVIAVVRLALMQYAIFVTHLSVVEWTKKPGSHCHACLWIHLDRVI